MNTHRLLLILLALLLTPALAPSSDNWETGVLYPGESITKFGLTVSWTGESATPVPKPEAGETTSTAHSGPWGKLTFRGPKNVIENLMPPETDMYVYLDGVCVRVRNYKKRNQQVSGIEMEFIEWPANRVLGGAPDKFLAAISNVCPLTLNEWTFTVSDKPVPLPDGSEALTIFADDKKTGRRETLPAVYRAVRSFGRFRLAIGYITPEICTVVVNVEVDKDPSVRGRLAWVESESFRKHESCEQFFARLSEQYGFGVEWGTPEDRPIFVKMLRERTANGTCQMGKCEVEEVVRVAADGDCLSGYPSLKASWIDDQTLLIRPGNIEETEAELRTQAERNERYKRDEALRAELESRFEKDYALVTQVYSLKRMSAATARALVETRLQGHYLARIDGATNLPADSPQLSAARPLMNKAVSVRASDGLAYGIVSIPAADMLAWVTTENGAKDMTSQAAIKSARETCVMDEKANAVIVTAIPKTQQDVAALIEQMEGVLTPGKQAAAPRRIRVQAILLRGEQGKVERASSADAPHPSSARLPSPQIRIVEVPAAQQDQSATYALIIDGLNVKTANDTSFCLSQTQGGLQVSSMCVGSVYTVHAAPFSTKEQAENWKKEFEKEGGLLSHKEAAGASAKASGNDSAEKFELVITENLQEKDAGLIKTRLEEQGFFPVRVSSDPNGTFSVRHGTFRTEDEARQQWEYMEREEGLKIIRIDHTGGTDVAGQGDAIKMEEPSDASTKGIRDPCIFMEKDKFFVLVDCANKSLAPPLKSHLINKGWEVADIVKKPGDISAMTVIIGPYPSELEARKCASEIGRYKELQRLQGKWAKRRPSAPKDGELEPKYEVVVAENLSDADAKKVFETLQYEGYRSVRSVKEADGKSSIRFGPLGKSEAENLREDLSEKGWMVAARIEKISPPAEPTPVPDLAAQYGIRPEDLTLFPKMDISEMGRAVVDILAEPGPNGQALTTLGGDYQCELEYQDERAPYIILKGRLKENFANKSLNRTLLENSVYLEPGKPSLLGVTNLNQALILLLRVEEPTAAAAPPRELQ